MLADKSDSGYDLALPLLLKLCTARMNCKVRNNTQAAPIVAPAAASNTFFNTQRTTIMPTRLL
jgi:hypothetical protein